MEADLLFLNIQREWLLASSSSLRCDQVSFTKFGWQRRNEVKPIEMKHHLALGRRVFCRNAFPW